MLILVTRKGFEPLTHTLKVYCSKPTELTNQSLLFFLAEGLKVAKPPSLPQFPYIPLSCSLLFQSSTLTSLSYLRIVCPFGNIIDYFKILYLDFSFYQFWFLLYFYHIIILHLYISSLRIYKSFWFYYLY